MSPSVTIFGREVRHLDADRLLARDRRQDPDLRRRERVGEVVLQRRDLRHLRARARAGARSGSRAGRRSGRRSSPRCRSARAPVTSVSAVRWSAPFDAGAAAARPSARRGRAARTRPRRAGRRRAAAPRSPRRAVDEQRRRLGQALGDDVGVVVDDVDRRLVLRERGAAAPERVLALSGRSAAARRARADGVMGAAQQRAVRGAREQEPAGEQRGQAEQERAGAAEQLRDPAAERRSPTTPPWSRAERDHQPDGRDDEAGPERASRRAARCGRASGRRRPRARAARRTRPSR